MISKVKICGLTCKKDVDAAIKYGASYLGFIVNAESSRKLSVTEASIIALPASKFCETVAVVVNPTNILIEKIIREMRPSYIQLHGDESIDRVADIKNNFKIKLIKAISIDNKKDFITAEQYNGLVDIMLYDSKPPSDSPQRGGHGLLFDWSMISEVPLPKIWALAGGLNISNVEDAINLTKAPILDVSSGLELMAGLKDHNKIKAFMDKIKNE
jgi:phosphoribosylanthranilate isomerase